MTRADKIRTMSDEELAVKIANILLNAQDLITIDGKRFSEEVLPEQVLWALRLTEGQRDG